MSRHDVDQGTDCPNHDVLYRDWAELLEIHDGQPARRLREFPGRRWRRSNRGLIGAATGAAGVGGGAGVAGVLYLVAPGMPLGSPRLAQELSPGWAIGWYPYGGQRRSALEFAAQADEITSIDVSLSLMRLELGPELTVDVLIGDAQPLVDALRSTPLASRLSAPSIQGAGFGPAGPRPPDVRPRRPMPTRYLAVAVVAVALRLTLLIYTVSSRSSTEPVASTGTFAAPGPPKSPGTPESAAPGGRSPGRAPGYNGPAYPGMLVQDHIANSSGQVQLFGTTATAVNLRPALTTFGGRLLCADVVLEAGASASSFSDPFGWTLGDPSGAAHTVTVDGTLPFQAVVPGGSVKGTVCFNRPAQRGTFVLLWSPYPWAEGGVWPLTPAP